MSIFNKIINIFIKHPVPKGRKYGWVPDKKDERDQLFFFRPKKVLPKSVDLRPQMPPVYNQGNLSSCVANGVVAASEFLWMKRPGYKYDPSSRLFVYYNGRVIEDSVGEDGGLMIRDGIKAVVKYGECLEAEWAYDESKVFDKPTQNCYDHALTHQVLIYKKVSSSLEDMKNCLASGYPFVFGAVLYESFESDGVERTGIVPLPRSRERVVGSHCMASVGYDDSRDVFIVRNSWGDWGQGGHCFIPYKYLTNSRLCNNFWMITDIE